MTFAKYVQEETAMESAESNTARSPVIGIISRNDHSAMWKGYALCGQGLSYVRSVALAGGVPLIIPLELGESAWRRIYERLDGLLFPGGVDVNPLYYGEEPHPRLGKVDDPLDQAELILARWAIEDHFPLLAICRGIQLINVAAGGSLYQDLPAQLPDAFPHACNAPTYPREYRAHAVHIESGSRLATAMGTTQCKTNSRHHQAVKDLAPGFIMTARAPDGVIEGIEHTAAPFIVGVQWHPESLTATDPQMLAIFEALVEASRQHKARSDLLKPKDRAGVATS
jgi:putative glutamine amidotransferase